MSSQQDPAQIHFRSPCLARLDRSTRSAILRTGDRSLLKPDGSRFSLQLPYSKVASKLELLTTKIPLRQLVSS